MQGTRTASAAISAETLLSTRLGESGRGTVRHREREETPKEVPLRKHTGIRYPASTSTATSDAGVCILAVAKPSVILPATTAGPEFWDEFEAAAQGVG